MNTTYPYFSPQPSRAASSIEELLALHDEAFIRCAYVTVLDRDPDPEGFRHFLFRVRSGESRLSIVASMRLSLEGRQQEYVLDGLDRAIRAHRWRRWALLGPILRLLGVGRERVDLRRQIAAVEAKLHRLADPVHERHIHEQLSARQLRSDRLQTLLTQQRIRTGELEVRLVSRQLRANELAARVSELQRERENLLASFSKSHLRDFQKSTCISTSSKLSWRITRDTGTAGDLLLTRIEMARALHELGIEVSPVSSEAAADITALFAFPPSLLPVDCGSHLLVGLGSDETCYPAEWVNGVNQGTAGVACTSRHAAKILIDCGVTVPVATIGLGVDDWERVYPSPDYRAPGRAFRFLHVSNCGISDGTDLLLESFGRAFAGNNNVSLIIVPLTEVPSELVTTLERLRSAHPSFPEVVLLQSGLSDADLKSLYGQCEVFVGSSRSQGFGLPSARALLSGLPVVVTAWGGHLDYCDDTNAYLVDYRFLPANTSKDLTPTVWVEPTVVSLDASLRMAYEASPAERAAKASAGRERLLGHFTWKDAALRLVSLAERIRSEGELSPEKSRMGWVTTWNVKCGIGTHAEHLLTSVPRDEFVVFAARQEPQIRADEANCFRAWDISKETNGLDAVQRQLEPLSIGTLVIQHNYGFYNHSELNSLIEFALAKGLVVFVELHSTVDTFGNVANYRLSDLLEALRKCHRILVHGQADMDRLKAIGLINNVMLLPHGIISRRRTAPSLLRQKTIPLIASFGFCFPNKGLLELVEAVSILKNEGMPVRLRMLNAVYPGEHSLPVAQQIKEDIKKYGLENEVELNTEFLEDDVCLTLLSETDLLVNPYQQTGESASGAVRYGLTSGIPVTVTPLPIFDDLGDAVFRMTGTSPQEIAQGIASALAHLKEESDVALHVQKAARRWSEAHDYPRQIALLQRIALTLSRRGH